MSEIQWGPDVTPEYKRKVLVSYIAREERVVRTRAMEYHRLVKIRNKAHDRVVEAAHRRSVSEARLASMRVELASLPGTRT